MRLMTLALALCSSAAFSNGLSIRDVVYHEDTNMLDIDISYGCGRDEHRFDLHADRIRQSYPMGITVTVRHLEGASDPAEMLCFKRLSYDVSTLPRPIVVHVTNEQGSSYADSYLE